MKGRLPGLTAFLLPGLLVGCSLVRSPPADPPSPGPPADLPPPAREMPAEPLPSPAPRELPPPAEAPDARAAAGARPPLGPLPGAGEVRALWVVRTALLHPDSARAAVARAHHAGFNTLLVQVRGRGDAYYLSSREPRPDQLAGQPEGYDPLALVLEEARARGLAVHAWVNAHVVASALLPPRNARHLIHRDPELLAVPRSLASELFHRDPRDPGYLESLRAWTQRNGGQVEGLYTNPAHPRVKDHVEAVVLDLLDRYDLDGIHLDYIRYPSPAFDYSRTSLEAFRDRVRHLGSEPALLVAAESGWVRDPFAYVNTFPALWDQFRREQVTALMDRLFVAAKSRRPGLLVSAAVFPGAEDAYGARYQDWERWLREGIVDVVALMAYTTSDPVFEAQVRRAAAVAGPLRVWAGVGAYRNSFHGAVAKGRIAEGLGVSGTVLFSYDWAVGPEGTGAGGGAYLERYAREAWSGRSPP
jgi:uncharacterized lipoprotein YddW (UPF0748 family)